MVEIARASGGILSLQYRLANQMPGTRAASSPHRERPKPSEIGGL
jgi:hypothetical protein